MAESMESRIRRAASTTTAKTLGSAASVTVRETEDDVDLADDFDRVGAMIALPILCSAEKSLLQNKIQAIAARLDIGGLKPEFRGRPSFGLFVKLSNSRSHLSRYEHLGWHFICFCYREKDDTVLIVEWDQMSVPGVPQTMKLADLTAERVSDGVSTWVEQQLSRYPTIPD